MRESGTIHSFHLAGVWVALTEGAVATMVLAFAVASVMHPVVLNIPVASVPAGLVVSVLPGAPALGAVPVDGTIVPAAFIDINVDNMGHAPVAGVDATVTLRGGAQNVVAAKSCTSPWATRAGTPSWCPGNEENVAVDGPLDQGNASTTGPDTSYSVAIDGEIAAEHCTHLQFTVVPRTAQALGSRHTVTTVEMELASA